MWELYVHLLLFASLELRSGEKQKAVCSSLALMSYPWISLHLQLHILPHMRCLSMLVGWFVCLFHLYSSHFHHPISVFVRSTVLLAQFQCFTVLSKACQHQIKSTSNCGHDYSSASLYWFKVLPQKTKCIKGSKEVWTFTCCYDNHLKGQILSAKGHRQLNNNKIKLLQSQASLTPTHQCLLSGHRCCTFIIERSNKLHFYMYSPWWFL